MNYRPKRLKPLKNPSLSKLSFNKAQLLAFTLIFGGLGGYVLTHSFAAGSAIPVPNAATNGVTVGPGFVRSSTRQVIRTAGNTVYIFAVDDDVCQGTTGSAVLRAYKGSGAQAANANVPTSFAEVDAANHPVSAGSADCTGNNSSMLEDPDVKLDPSGIAHLVYIDEKSGTVYYQTFSTVTDTWGTRTALATTGSTTSGASWPRTGQTALTLDSNNAPWVVFATAGTSNAIQYTNLASGSWSTPATIFTGTNEMHPSLATSADGSLHLAWLDNALASHGTIKYAHYAGGAWGAVETVSSGDSTVLANGDDDQGPTIATDTSSRPHVLYMDGTVSGSDDYVRMRYRTGAGVWTDNTPPGGAGGASNPSGTWFAHTPGNYVSSADGDYVFLGHDANIEFGYQYQVGGVGSNWGAYTTLDPRSKTNPAPGDTCEPGQDGAASVRFDPLRDNNPNLIDVAYYDERDNTDCTHHHATVFYKAIDISATIPSGPTANLWVDTDGGSCTRSATPVAYDTAAACGTIAAAWTAAQPGDLIMAKGGTYSSGFSASGAKSSMVTIQAAPGENPWFAGDGNLSGVTNMTVTDDRSVNLATESGIANGLTMGFTTISGSSANINFNNIDIWCQTQSPWHVVTGPTVAGSPQQCSAPLLITGVNGFTMSGGSQGPMADCQLSGCANRTDISKVTACSSNSACNNITFDHVLFHDNINLDGNNSGHVHNEMWKIDQGQNITFKSSKFVRCNSAGACDSAVIFLGQSGSSPTANNLSFIGNAFGPAGNASVAQGYCSPSPCTPTLTFKYNSSANSFSILEGVSSYTNYAFIGNAAYKANFDCNNQPGATFANNKWFTQDPTTPAAQCSANDNPGSTNVNLSTWWTNYSSGDFSLPAGSPLIDVGGSGCNGLTDYAGTARPLGTACDAGAFESTASGGGGGGGTDTTPPSSPSNLAKTASTANSITVGWTASTDNVGVAGYDLYRSAVKTGTTTATSATFSSLSCGTSYTLGIDAFDAAGNQSPAASLTASTATCSVADTTPPSVPANTVKTSSTTTSISFSWSASTDNVAVAGYRVYKNGSAIATTTQLNYTLTGLSCGTSYTIGLTAYDAAGNESSLASDQGPMSTSTCPVTPPPTISLTASPGTIDSGDSTSLSWSTTNATTCTATGAWSGSKSTSGSASTGSLTSSSSYTLTCSGPGGSSQASVTVTVKTSLPTPTPTPTPTPSYPTGDLNHDGQVDIYDLSILLSNWDSANNVSDLNGSGRVDIYDLSILLSHYGG